MLPGRGGGKTDAFGRALFPMHDDKSRSSTSAVLEINLFLTRCVIVIVGTECVTRRRAFSTRAKFAAAAAVAVSSRDQRGIFH